MSVTLPVVVDTYWLHQISKNRTFNFYTRLKPLKNPLQGWAYINQKCISINPKPVGTILNQRVSYETC